MWSLFLRCSLPHVSAFRVDSNTFCIELPRGLPGTRCAYNGLALGWSTSNTSGGTTAQFEPANPTCVRPYSTLSHHGAYRTTTLVLTAVEVFTPAVLRVNTTTAGATPGVHDQHKTSCTVVTVMTRWSTLRKYVVGCSRLAYCHNRESCIKTEPAFATT